MRRETVWFPAAFFAHRKARKRGLQQRAHTKGMQPILQPAPTKQAEISAFVRVRADPWDRHGSFHAPKQVNMTAR